LFEANWPNLQEFYWSWLLAKSNRLVRFGAKGDSSALRAMLKRKKKGILSSFSSASFLNRVSWLRQLFGSAITSFLETYHSSGGRGEENMSLLSILSRITLKGAFFQAKQLRGVAGLFCKPAIDITNTINLKYN